MRRLLDELERLAGRQFNRPARAVVLILVVVWALGVANLTLFVAAGEGPRNAVPFHTIWDYLSDTNLPIQIRFRNLAGNLVMLAPLGLALAVLTRWRLARAAACLLVVSGAIELWQLLVATGRSVDVDDVILNVTGGVIGWFLGLVILRLAEAVEPSALEDRDTETQKHGVTEVRGAGGGAPRDAVPAADSLE